MKPVDYRFRALTFLQRCDLERTLLEELDSQIWGAITFSLILDADVVIYIQ